MKLRANAALRLKGRRQLCRRVLEEGWTVTEAAEAIADPTGAAFVVAANPTTAGPSSAFSRSGSIATSVGLPAFPPKS